MIEDSYIIDKFLNGDKDIFKDIITKYNKSLINFIRFYTGLKDECEDILQEVFIETYKSIKNFNRNSSFKTWLYGITINICRTYRRNHQKNLKFISNNSENSKNETLNSIPDFTYNPERIYTLKEEKEILFNILETLPEKYKSLIFLRDTECFSYKEISNLLNIPVGTVRSRIHNATVLILEKYQYYLK